MTDHIYKPDPDGAIVARGKIFELVQTPQPDGRVFEVARRAPGVRVIVADKAERKVLLMREFRHEIDDWDYRLPGGKVFDTLDELSEFRDGGADIMEPARAKAVAEVAEETGYVIGDVRYVGKSALGATVEWDLYVFEATDWHQPDNIQNLEAGEQVESVDRYDYALVEEMIMKGHMQEDRIAMMLLRWLKKENDDAN